MLLPYKSHVLTITADNGPEFAQHKEIARRLATKVCFAHPYCSWEKGLIEDINKLYRQYVPKEAGFKDFDDERIKKYNIKSMRDQEKTELQITERRIFPIFEYLVAFWC